MNCNPNTGAPIRMPGIMPPTGPGRMPCSMPMTDRFPVGMGYVPMQNWETPYPMDHALHRGTIFPSLDYPFMMGRCRR